MRLYKFCKRTREHIETKDIIRARLDPLESKKQGKEIFLIPAFTTTKEPPKHQDKKAVFIYADWQLVDDFRGKDFYKKDNGDHVSFSLGGIPGDDVTTKAKPDDNSIWNEEKQKWSKDTEKEKNKHNKHINDQINSTDGKMIKLLEEVLPVLLGKQNLSIEAQETLKQRKLLRDMIIK